MQNKPLCLVVMDGFGLAAPSKVNAITLANPVNFNTYFKEYPSSILQASGEAVGLPDGQMGGSEVGHLTMGAGTVLFSDLAKINRADFSKNEQLNSFLKNIKDLHLVGQVSDGGVHSHINHLFKLIDVVNDKIKNIYIHIFTDGRDVAKASALTYTNSLEEYIKPYKNVKIASVSGRFYAMDREMKMDRTMLAYNTVVNAESAENYNSVTDCINANYKKEVFDEFIVSALICSGKRIEDGDGLLFFNFRSDRPKQFCNQLLKERPKIVLATMTNFGLEKPSKYILFTPDRATNSLGNILSKNGFKQLRISETTKSAHVTYFFNGGTSDTPSVGEKRIEVPSEPVKTFDLLPKMSTPKVVDILINEIKENNFDFYLVNLSNPDMVGHCANLNATIEAIKYVDECIKRIADIIKLKGGTTIITADHGNAEEGDTTAHTTNPVPFIIVKDELRGTKLKETGSLADVAPTVLELLNIKQPQEMKGKSLIIK